MGAVHVHREVGLALTEGEIKGPFSLLAHPTPIIAGPFFVTTRLGFIINK